MEKKIWIHVLNSIMRELSLTGRTPMYAASSTYVFVAVSVIYTQNTNYSTL